MTKIARQKDGLLGKGIYALVAIIRTEGKESRMSDDLISRKDVITIIENMIFEVGKDLSKSYLLQDAKERIRRLNTAFNKEKAIEELRKHSHNYYPSIDHYCLSKKAVDLKTAIEIAEKGGIE